MEFNASAQVPQLYFSSASVNTFVGSTQPQLFYLLPQFTSAPPATISLSDSWSTYSGCYLFLDTPLPTEQQQSFATAVWDFCVISGMQDVRFIWVSNPLQAGQGVPISGPVIGVYQPAGTKTPVTTRTTQFDFLGTTLFLGMNAAITLDSTSACFTMTSPSTNTYLMVQQGALQLPILSSAIMLPLTGDAAGCLRFTANLSQHNNQPDLANLDMGLQMFYADPEATPADAALENALFLTSLRYPVIDEAVSPDITLAANWDPLAPLDGTRTFWTFYPEDIGFPPIPHPPIPTSYASTLGYPFYVIPTSVSQSSNPARWVPALAPSSNPPGPQAPLYWVPQGDFVLQLHTGPISTPIRFMTGLSGVEYITLANQPMLTFFPGNPAFADRFPLPQNTYGPLKNPPTTAWATLRENTSLTYYTQPSNAVLYSAPQSSASAGTSPEVSAAGAFQPLSYLEVPTAPVPATGFPMMPYLNLQAENPDLYEQMEVQVLSPLRHRQITMAAANTAAPAVAGTNSDGPPVLGTTPQGFLAQFSPDLNTWQQLILAQMSTGTLMLTNIPNGVPLREALQSNQLFLVISDPTAIAPYFAPPNTQIDIAQWNFNVDPSVWENHKTLMLFKFYDKPLVELAQDISTWSEANAFNQDPEQTSVQLTAILQAAQQESDPNYSYFVQTVMHDPNWQGVLFLNVTVEIDQLPPQLEGIAAGIDLSRFEAHHIGINVSAINQTGGTLSVQNSSLFGLIDYQDTAPMVDDGNPYQYRVKMLKVLFYNSLVTSFSSQIQLKINQLFQEMATLQGSTDGNIMTLQGVYQSQTLPDGSTQNTYLFQTDPSQTIVFTMQSYVLNAVMIQKCQFVTLVGENSPDNPTVQTQFLFWGVLDFKPIATGSGEAVFDVFSFGSETGNSVPSGLAFSNLAINMSFNDKMADPSATTAFTFDALQLTPNLAGSHAREQSLYSHFPLTLNNFIQAQASDTPALRGYMGVETPIAQTQVQYPWYALNFNLNLGTLGNLAPPGDFTASFLVAWSPNAANYSIYTGMQLPGSTGGSASIQIEGPLHLSFQNIQLQMLSSDTGTVSYLLLFQTITVGLFGLSLPQSGQINMVLFGNPNISDNTNNTLGWYVAYAQSSPSPSPQALLSSLTPLSLAASGQR